MSEGGMDDMLKKLEEAEKVVKRLAGSVVYDYRGGYPWEDQEITVYLEEIEKATEAPKGDDILKKLAQAEKVKKQIMEVMQMSMGSGSENYIMELLDIPYSVAKEKVAEISKRLVEDPDQLQLVRDMDKYSKALQLTEEFQAEKDTMEREWEEQNYEPNNKALKALRRHMPVNIEELTETALVQTASPTGKFLPEVIAKRFKRTNVLMLLRKDPDDIENMDPASLEALFYAGLTLTERRALYAHLKPCGAKWKKWGNDSMTSRKWQFYSTLEGNFKDYLASHEQGEEETVDYLQGDYGWPEEAEYYKASKSQEVTNGEDPNMTGGPAGDMPGASVLAAIKAHGNEDAK